MADIRIDIKANDDASKKLGDVSKAMEGLEKETQKTGKTAQQTADQVTRLGGDFSSLGSNLDALINKYRSSTPENLKFAASIEKINREFDDGKISSQEAAKQLEAVKKAMGDTGGETKKATGIMQGFSGAMIGINQALELAGKGARAFQAAFDFARQGAVLNQTTESFERMAASLGPNINLLDELRAASRNTVDDLTLMSSVLTLTAGTSKELGDAMLQSSPRLMEIAKAASALNPTLGDTAWMFESINSGIKRNSPLILDNLGIVVRVGEANEKYAESLGKTVAELTAAETQQALLNEVLEAGGRLIEQAGNSAESALDPFDRMTASFENLKTGMAGLSDGTIPDVVTGLADFADGQMRIFKAEETLKKALDAGIITKKEYRQALYGNRDAFVKYAEALEDAIDQHERLARILAKGTTEMVYYEGAVVHTITANGEYSYTVDAARLAEIERAKALQATQEAIRANTAMQFDAYGVTLDLTDATARLAEEYRIKDALMGAMSGTLDQQIQQIADMSAEYQSMSSWQQQWGAGKGLAEEIASGLEAVNKQLLDMTVRQGVLTLLESGLEGGAQAALDMAREFGLIDERTYNLQSAMQNLKDYFEDTGDVDGYAAAVAHIYENAELLDGQVFTYTMIQEMIYRERREAAGGYATTAFDINEMNASGTGGKFRTVPPGYPNDSFIMGLTSGEEYLVRSRSEVGNGLSMPSYTSGGMGMSGGQTINVIIQSTFAPENEEQFKRMVRPAIVQIFREQEALQ